jgi:hypothetical protein
MMANIVRPGEPSNARYWCQLWDVTLVQLQIAASRAGGQPEKVLADILGATGAVARTTQPMAECFGRAHLRRQPVRISRGITRHDAPHDAVIQL